MRVIGLVAFAMVLAMGSRGYPAKPKEAGFIQIKGSDTMVNLAQAWAEAFMEKFPEKSVAVTGGGSGTGIAALISKTCDIAICSREFKGKERDMARARGVEPLEYKAALDGLAVVVHPNNPVGQLTVLELADIFTGKLKNWKEVGGPDAKLVILSREVNSGTHVYFKEHILRKNDPEGKEEFAPDALLLPSSQAIADEVAQNQAAIGYYGMGYISLKQKPILVARDAHSEYFPPTIENVVSQKYPISRPLFMYIDKASSGAVREFIDFVLSPEGQKVVLEIDFVPIKKY